MNPQNNEPQFHLINDTPKKSTRKKMIWIIVTTIIVILLGILAFLWWQEREQNSNLKRQLDSAKQEAAKQSTPVESTAVEQAKYTASVGKFTLTLPSNYAIIVDLDGPFEGGPATRLDIGTKSSQGEQTINSPHHARVEVGAYPVAGASYAERIKLETGDLASSDVKKLANIKVADIDAEVYELNGLNIDKKIFFTKNDIVYVITSHHSEATQPVLDDVLKGFKLN